MSALLEFGVADVAPGVELGAPRREMLHVRARRYDRMAHASGSTWSGNTIVLRARQCWKDGFAQTFGPPVDEDSADRSGWTDEQEAAREVH